MPKDKYKAVWLSHSSIKDFLACPRGYYYKNIYKNPRTGRKITIMKPVLALGQSIHALIDQLSTIKTGDRFTIPLETRFEPLWQKISGKRGGFASEQEEQEYKERALVMISLLQKHPGPLSRKTVRIKDDLPYYWFSEEEELILCGKIDWLEYVEKSDSIHIVDFKTGRVEEKEDSLQLPIYYLLATHVQKRPVSKISYWYIDKDTKPQSIALPNEEEAYKRIMETAQRIKFARKLNHFKCAKDDTTGCVYCAPLKAVIEGRGQFVGIGDFNEEIYVLPAQSVSL